jgi:hypothetical protein
MKGKEILNFLKTQVIIDTPIENIDNKKEIDNTLMYKYKERVRMAYNETI